MLKNFLRFALSAAALAALVLSQQPVPRPPAAQPPPAPALQSGIKVHGRWTVVVRNQDGSVAARREFENSIMADGSNLLPAVLSGALTPGSWGVVLASNNTGAPGPCNSFGGIPYGANPSYVALVGFCGISGSNLSVSLLPQASGSPGGEMALKLTGTFVAPAAGSLNLAATELQLCAAQPSSVSSLYGAGGEPSLPFSTVAPSACAAADGTYTENGTAIQWYFTATAFAPVAVIQGQTVQVTVLISFS